MKKNSGFTLIDLVITMLIISILTAIAYPSYNKSVARSKRRAAEACLSSYATYMERFYTSNLNYNGGGTTLPALDCASSLTSDYQFKLPSATLTQSAYVLNAVPQSAQAKRDSLCGTLTLDQAGNRGASGNATSDPNQCW